MYRVSPRIYSASADFPGWLVPVSSDGPTLGGRPDARQLIARAETMSRSLVGPFQPWPALLSPGSLARRISALAERGLKLRGRFQREGVMWLGRRARAGLFDDMGLGKTIQALVALPDHRRAGVLVIAPKSVQRKWAQHAAIWAPDYRVREAAGSRDDVAPDAGELVVCRWGSIPEHFTRRAPFLVVADEAHYAKNEGALRTDRARAIAWKASGVWLLTGTPLQVGNRPSDLYNVLGLAGLDLACGGTLEEFQNAFFVMETKTTASAGSPLLADLLSTMSLRRLKEDVLRDLPARSFEVLEVPVTDRALRRRAEQLLDSLGGEKGLRAMVLDAAKSRAMADRFGAHFLAARRDFAAAKLPYILDLAYSFESAREPIVVFSEFRAVVEALGRRRGWGVYHGGTPRRDRDETVAAFQRGELKGIAVTSAAAEGIDLTRAAVMVRADLSMRAINGQMADRIYRIGQTRRTRVIDVVGDHPLDRAVRSILCAREKVRKDVGL